MAETSECKINLTAIQRVDPTITDIIDNSPQTALYKYGEKLMKWERLEIEGTFFVYKRNKIPPHGYIIMNRLNTTNKVECLCDITDIQLQTPYFLYKKKSGDIYGIWFYKGEDCIRIARQIEKIMSSPEEIKLRYRRQRCVSESESHSMKSKLENSGSSDILALLANAQMEYDKKSNLVNVSKNNPHQQNDQNNVGNALSSTNGHGINGTTYQDPGQLDKTSSRKRFLSSGHTSINHGRDKALLARWLSGPESADTNGQTEESAQLPRSRAVSLCIEGSKRHPLLFQFDEASENFDSGTNSTERLLSKSFTSSNFCSAPSSYSKTPSQMLTPDMFEKNVPKPSVCKELFRSENPKSMCNSSMFPSLGNLKDSLMLGVAQPTLPANTMHQTTEPLLSPRDFQGQSISGGYVNSYVPPQDGNNICDDGHSCKKPLSPVISKDQLRDSLIYMLTNDPDMLSRIHEAYISSLKTHFNNFKK